MYEAYFATLEKQAVRFETVASKVEDEDKRILLDCVAGLRKEVQTLREQVRLSAVQRRSPTEFAYPRLPPSRQQSRIAPPVSLVLRSMLRTSWRAVIIGGSPAVKGRTVGAVDRVDIDCL